MAIFDSAIKVFIIETVFYLECLVMIGNFSLLHQEIFQNAASIDSIKHVKTTI
jgi:hypothetical protein